MTKPWNAPPISGIHRQKREREHPVLVACCIICQRPDPPLMHYMDGYAHRVCIERRHKHEIQKETSGN